MINRRSLISAVAGSSFASSFGAGAQPKDKVWRIGYIGAAPPGTSPTSEQLWGVFVQTLRDNGFVEGKNIAFERRAAEGRDDLAAVLAAELVNLNVDVIVANQSNIAHAAKAATTTIPIVMAGSADPVGSGLAISLARPGGNVTGLSDFNEDLQPKRLELLKAMVPKAARIAVLQADDIRVYGPLKGEAIRARLDTAAKALGITLRRIAMNAPQDLQSATAAIVRERVDAILATNDSMYTVRKEFADFAIQQRLPSMVAARPAISGGALMSYGADYADVYRKVALYVVKILNGAKSADLPIEQPTKVELIINLKTANAIGLTVPKSLMLRADEVIR